MGIKDASRLRLPYLDILRAFAVITVVFYHVYGMMYNSPYRIEDTAQMYNALYFNINRGGFVVLSMPIFIFISGYLYAVLLGRGKYQDTKIFIMNKFKRLLLPFFVFAVAMMLTDYMLWSTDYFKDSLYNIFIRGMWKHLWFLPMLFWSFMLTSSLKGLLKKPAYQILLLIITFIPTLLPEPQLKLFGITFLSKWYFWFCLGYIVSLYKDTFFYLTKKYRLNLVLFIVGVVLYLIGKPLYPQFNFFSATAVVLLLLFALYITHDITSVKHTKGLLFRIIASISKYSFGIYIFHYWIAPYLISDKIQQLLPIASMAQQHYYLFPFVFFVLTFILSFVATYYFQKTKIGKYLLG